MIKRIKKIPLLRYAVIILLVTIIFSGAVYLYLHNNGTRKLQVSVNKLITSRENSELIDSCLLNLYNADNNSRLYAVTGDKKYIREFTAGLKTLDGLLSRLHSTNGTSKDSSTAKLKELLNEKADRTNSYMKLRLVTDSLITATLKMDSAQAASQPRMRRPVTQTVNTVVHVDTIKAKAGAVPFTSKPTETRKKFLGKIASVFARKKEINADTQALSVTPVIIKTDSIRTTTLSQTVYTPTPEIRTHYQRLYKARKRLQVNEHAALLINNNLLNDIITRLKKYKSDELALASVRKAEVDNSFTDFFNEFSYLSRITLLVLIVMLAVVFYNIWKIFSNEIDLIAYSEKAEEYARNKSNFMASMSHEIRTPLNSLIGFSEQLGMSTLTPEQTVQINAIRSSSTMLLEVVNEILDFSKYETGKMSFEHQPFMPYNALMEVFNTVGIQAAKKGLNLKKNILVDKDLCFNGDMLRLKQVVMNLMVNAIKFTPSGEVCLQAMLLRKAKGKRCLKVRIKDTGIGIRKKSLATVFDEFSQVDDSQHLASNKGTGLGLAICKKIIELQGGKIKVVSEPGKGSVFSFELPFELAEKNASIADETISDAELSVLVTGAHVLLAEDNQLNVLLAKTILKKWRISCDVAYDGREALTLFEQDKYDMLLTDIQMPVMGGLELVSLIRSMPNSLKAETPIIALTANVLKENRDEYFSVGVNDIVLKPFNERDLIEKISLALKSKYSKTADMLSQYGDNV